MSAERKKAVKIEVFPKISKNYPTPIKLKNRRAKNMKNGIMGYSHESDVVFCITDCPYNSKRPFCDNKLIRLREARKPGELYIV